MNLLPDIIYRNYKGNSFSGKLYTHIMYIDIIGFTAMTEQFMQNSKEGAEKLSIFLNEIYQPVIELVKNYQGDVISFAGDSLCVLFDNTMTSHQILECAVLIEETFTEIKNKMIDKENVQIGVKIGLAFGHVHWEICGKENFRQYYFRSQTITNAYKAQAICHDTEIKSHKSFTKPVLNKRPVEEFTTLRKEMLNDLKKDSSLIQKTQATTDIDPQTLEAIQAEFYPLIHDTYSYKGEFRQIVCVFISINANIDMFVKAINELIVLSEDYGAYLNKIDVIDNPGPVMLVFGAPVSYENNVYRAQALVNHFRISVKKIVKDYENFMANKSVDLSSRDYTIELKAGISFGNAFAGFVGSSLRSEYTCLGDTVNVAARLCMAAEWNTVLATKEIVDLSKNWFQYEAKKALPLRGKSFELEVFALNENVVRTDDFYDNPFSGREIELIFLRKQITTINKGRAPYAIYIYGEAGVGKSRLIHEMIRKEANHINFIHIYTDNIIKKSFNPIKSWINKYFKIDHVMIPAERNTIFDVNYELFLKQLKHSKDKRSDEFYSELKNKSDFIKSLLNIQTSNPQIQSISPKDLYEIVSYVLNRFFLALSLIQKTCIILEDLQYIDNDTYQLINSISKNSFNFPLLFLISSRYNDDGSKIPLKLADLRIVEIPLKVFKHKELSEMVEKQIQGRLSKELINFIGEKSGNNPFYIEQICHYLLENNLLIKKNKAFVPVQEKIEIPGTINALIVSRIDRLSRELKDIIQIASVIGREVDISLLNEMLNEIYQSHNSFEQKYRDIENEQIWVLIKQLKYIFRHVLIQEAIYDMQLRQRLRQLHESCAISMEKIYEARQEYFLNIAWHYEKAGNEDKAKTYYMQAGDYLATQYLNQKALEAYDKVLELDPENLTYLEVLDKKVKIYNLTGMKNEENRSIQEGLIFAKNIKSDYFYMRFLTKQGDFNRSISNYEDAQENYEKALKLSQKLNNFKEEADIKGFLGIVFLRRGKYDEAKACFDFKIKVCQTLNDIKGEAYAISNIGVIYLRRSQFEQALESYEYLKMISEKIHDKFGEILALGNIALIWYNKGDLDKAEHILLEEIRICKEIGDVNRISNAYNNLGSVYWAKDDLKNALKYYEMDKYNCEIRGDKHGLAYAIGNMGLIYYASKEYQKSIKSFTYWAEECEKFQDYYGMTTALSNISQVYLDTNQIDLAIQVLEKNKNICEKTGDEGQLSLTIGNIGSIHFEKGELDKALECYLYRLKLILKNEEKVNYFVTYSNLARIYAEKAFHDESEAYFQLAIKEAEFLKSDKKLAETLSDYLRYKLDYHIPCNYKHLLHQIEDLAAKLNEDDDIKFSVDIARCRILSLSHPEKAVIEFEKLLNNHTIDQNRGLIFYHIWRITQDPNYHQKALEMYKQLNQNKHEYSYRKKIKELEANKPKF